MAPTNLALLLAALTALCFGIGLVTSRIGLRTSDARTGAAVSVPTAALLFLLAAPFMLEARGFNHAAVLWFTMVGLFFPAFVSLLTNRANETLGPTITGAVSGTAPLFALLAAGLLLGERIPAQAGVAAVAIVLGVALVSWKHGAVRSGFAGRALLWPVAGAMVRGLAQVAAKMGLLLWPNPFVAGLIAYLVSSGVVVGVNRIGRARRPRLTRHGLAWGAITGALNGGAVLLMYSALNIAPVSLVAPIVATYPLVTALAVIYLVGAQRGAA